MGGGGVSTFDYTFSDKETEVIHHFFNDNVRKGDSSLFWFF